MSDKTRNRLEWVLRRMEGPVYSLAYLPQVPWDDDAILANIVESLTRELMVYLDHAQRMMGGVSIGSPYSDEQMDRWLNERSEDAS